MGKTKKNNSRAKNKTIRRNKSYKTKSIKIYKIPSRTPYYIEEISQNIYNSAPKHFHPLHHSELLINTGEIPDSYSPTINKELVLLQSIERKNIYDCNNEKAFELKEVLKIGIPGHIYGKSCVPYYDPKAIKFLLKNLSANKHIYPEKIIPPIQNLSNCWFNTMFVTLFVSDKGRKFFHFFRQLMIEGIQSNGKKIPDKLRDSFALLNYAIDACLTGNEYAYNLNTNAIIQTVYSAIPTTYKLLDDSIPNVGDAGNPIRYYLSLINYLHNKSLQLMFIKNANNNWKEMILKQMDKLSHIPHIIIIEIYDGVNNTAGLSGITTNKPRSFLIKGVKYSLDSCIIRDTSQQHFCCTLTCENKEMAYDGMSFHRLVPLTWKKYINSNYFWEFEGSNDLDDNSLKWNFVHGYQMLIYYRVK